MHKYFLTKRKFFRWIFRSRCIFCYFRIYYRKNSIRGNSKYSNNKSETFFLRRARRILPIFLIVILITNVLVYFVAFPDNTKEIILSSVFSQLSIANFFFTLKVCIMDLMLQFISLFFILGL